MQQSKKYVIVKGQIYAYRDQNSHKCRNRGTQCDVGVCLDSKTHQQLLLMYMYICSSLMVHAHTVMRSFLFPQSRAYISFYIHV